jgi:hypothetical protein
MRGLIAGASVAAGSEGHRSIRGFPSSYFCGVGSNKDLVTLSAAIKSFLLPGPEDRIIATYICGSCNARQAAR